MPDAQCASRLGSGILLRSSWIVSLVFLFDPFGCMMILLPSWMFSVFDGASSSIKVTLDAESISAVMCILLGLVQPGSDIKLLTKFLVYNFIPFPSVTPSQLLWTHRSFQVAPPLLSRVLLWYHVLDLLRCMLHCWDECGPCILVNIITRLDPMAVCHMCLCLLLHVCLMLSSRRS